MRRDRIYFLLVKLPDGILASLTVIREPHRFIAQLQSFDFKDYVKSSYTTDELDDMTTDRFLEEVATMIRRGAGKTYTYSIPSGMTRTDWLMGVEERANDPSCSGAPVSKDSTTASGTKI